MSTGRCYAARLSISIELLVVTVEGLSFEVRRGGRILVARGGPGATYEAARDSALLHAQKALDLFSIRGVDDLAISGVFDDHVAWWPTPDGLASERYPLHRLASDYEES
jgi:hypothetical protein